MTSDQIILGISTIIIVYFIYRKIKFSFLKKELPKLLNEGAIIVDVRSPAEYAQGSKPGSINIPLNELTNRVNELDKSKKIVLCCASGARSGMAAGILNQKGFHTVNAGPWSNTL